MSFQTPLTIKAGLDAIQRQEFVLPAIQREFVWDATQICSLFDSIMRGYPIGSFLFWKVEAARVGDHLWYGFIKDYHQGKARHCPVLDVPSHAVTAIIDGQQRLTGLNIGLRGSHAAKEPRKWRNNPDAFPTKYLYLNLCAEATNDENEQDLKYDFRFLTEGRAKEWHDEQHSWLKVSHVFGFTSSFQTIEYLQENALGNNKLAAKTLHQLYMTVHEAHLVPYFQEGEQSLDKVLNIFIRVNSGGTPLSYSDLLLSIASAEWQERDARDAIHGLVDELNAIRAGFQFSKDIVLKSGLMLSDIESVAFRVTNFNHKNMETLDQNWDRIASALRLGAGLLADFGFSTQNLPADSVLIPVAYYLYSRGLDAKYRTAPADKKDRERMRGWICRSLIKAGVWGSGLDTLLLALREVLRDAGNAGFPVESLEAAMNKRGKGLQFTEDELQDLVDSNSGEKRTFALLAIMYPFLDLRNVFHIDHVFPISRFTRTKLRKAGISEKDIDDFLEQSDRLSNLQLLDGAANISKQAKMPAEWLADYFPIKEARDDYRERNDLGAVPENLNEFGSFYVNRRDRLLARLRKVLQVAGATSAAALEG
jgi:hypothetical protein